MASPDWLRWVSEHWQAIGGVAGLGTVTAMVGRPRLRLAMLGGIGGPGGTYPEIDPNDEGFRSSTGPGYIRAVVWNYGLTPAEDCSVYVDRVWPEHGPAPHDTFMRSPLAWTNATSDGDRFAPRKLLPGQKNGQSVDVCVLDPADPDLCLLSRAHSVSGIQHRYAVAGYYAIDLIAQSSSFWTTPARSEILINYLRSERKVGLIIAGATSRRHLLKVI